MSLLASSEGAELSLLAFDGKWLVLEAPRAWAPGSPMAIRVEFAGTPHMLDARSLGSRRDAPGRFRVKLRLVSMRRDSRQALLEALPATPPPRA
ncbi:MAG: hypothetical protein GXP55_02580 [Deltaproteobacteria bacterium]|nr:hypothetical protein [Deltaproteobacteria bacterium]